MGKDTFCDVSGARWIRKQSGFRNNCLDFQSSGENKTIVIVKRIMRADLCSLKFLSVSECDLRFVRNPASHTDVSPMMRSVAGDGGSRSTTLGGALVESSPKELVCSFPQCAAFHGVQRWRQLSDATVGAKAG